MTLHTAFSDDVVIVPCGDIGCRTGNGIMQCSPVQPIQPIFHFLCDILCPHMVFTLLYFLVIPIGSSLFRPLRFLLALLILPAVSFGSGRRERERRHRHCTGHLPVSLRIDRAKTYLFASVTPYNKLTNCLIPWGRCCLMSHMCQERTQAVQATRRSLAATVVAGLTSKRLASIKFGPHEGRQKIIIWTLSDLLNYIPMENIKLGAPQVGKSQHFSTSGGLRISGFLWTWFTRVRVKRPSRMEGKMRGWASTCFERFRDWTSLVPWLNLAWRPEKHARPLDQAVQPRPWFFAIHFCSSLSFSESKKLDCKKYKVLWIPPPSRFWIVYNKGELAI